MIKPNSETAQPMKTKSLESKPQEIEIPISETAIPSSILFIAFIPNL